MIFLLTLLFWVCMSFGVVVAWWLCCALRDVGCDPLWRGLTRDE
jgi:hypothetical protein